MKIENSTRHLPPSLEWTEKGDRKTSTLIDISFVLSIVLKKLLMYMSFLFFPGGNLIPFWLSKTRLQNISLKSSAHTWQSDTTNTNPSNQNSNALLLVFSLHLLWLALHAYNANIPT